MDLQAHRVVEVQISACQYIAYCKAGNCRQRGSYAARYLDAQGRLDHLMEMCGPHIERLIGREKAHGLKVTDRRRW